MDTEEELRLRIDALDALIQAYVDLGRKPGNRELRTALALRAARQAELDAMLGERRPVGIAGAGVSLP